MPTPWPASSMLDLPNAAFLWAEEATALTKVDFVTPKDPAVLAGSSLPRHCFFCPNTDIQCRHYPDLTPDPV